MRRKFDVKGTWHTELGSYDVDTDEKMLPIELEIGLRATGVRSVPYDPQEECCDVEAVDGAIVFHLGNGPVRVPLPSDVVEAMEAIYHEEMLNDRWFEDEE